MEETSSRYLQFGVQAVWFGVQHGIGKGTQPLRLRRVMRGAVRDVGPRVCRDAACGDEYGAQGGAATHEPGLDGAEVDMEEVGDLVVGEAFDLAQHDDRAEGLRNLAECGFDALADLLLRGLVEGRAAAVGQRGGERVRAG